mmetsp:Transcript_7870/g.11615  ORF Transcript_7870/g.11615 Transcript_7870/m.11615 type:complete len:216 (+) Transcript_7870:100-747(+)|eukprot:CAMPEP_0196811824 /NCGR_PEP_ID=MMETSP1362-20130617/20077_1 /TAXON_ID=163516 /ORGANISM="Leptocylindrus danicus, Strain CCMP1856" /LENGTH=215 /DNA_ID=CAMNT_0042187207 /DNA_START=46 /DNA_END=693 /DNA_ORIENTATION=-
MRIDGHKFVRRGGGRQRKDDDSSSSSYRRDTAAKYAAISIAAVGVCMIGITSCFSGQSIPQPLLPSQSYLRGGTIATTTIPGTGVPSVMRDLSGKTASKVTSPLHAAYKVGNINNVVSIRRNNAVIKRKEGLLLEEEKHLEADHAETGEDYDSSEADRIIRDELVDALVPRSRHSPMQAKVIDVSDSGDTGSIDVEDGVGSDGRNLKENVYSMLD